MLTVVKPSPLRLWGFVLTVIGGALLAFGSLSDWAAVTIGGSTENAVPTKGVDLWQGIATLVLGVLIVVGILALRLVQAERRASVAIVLLVLGALSLAVVLWSAAALDGLVSGVDALVDAIVAQVAIPETQARELVEQAASASGIEVVAQGGLWLTLAGAIVATIGGVVNVIWVRRKRALGDAIDVDTRGERREPPGPPDAAEA